MPAQVKANSPRVAIVTPIFRHSVLLTEAIESALEQSANFPIAIILVNDGCPHTETDSVCIDYATAFPDTVVYLKKLNGGLSSARNHGIKYALEHFPSVEAIYLLDADNRLRKNSISRGMKALESQKSPDWIYPNIDMFGVNWSGDYSGDYSLLIHTTMNICEAGSLIHRRVFDAGVYFDETMRLGFEDWDFFLSAAEAGFRGENIPDFGLRYRKRPESMLANSHRDQDEIKGGMLRKHKSIMTPRALVSLEQDELPRYACYLSDKNQYKLSVDLSLPSEMISTDLYSQKIWNSIVSQSRAHSPAYLLVASTPIFEKLQAGKLMHWVLWRLEQLVETNSIATLTLRESDVDRISITTTEDTPGAHLQASIVMLSPRCYREVLLDSGTQWINSLATENCHPKIANVTVTIPAANGHHQQEIPSTAVYQLLAQIHSLRNSPFANSVVKQWEWRSEGIPERARAHSATRQQFDGHPSYPKVTNNAKHVGFALPLVEFGGVEKVTLNIAQSMRKKGWTPHLFILESNDIAFPKEWHETFESVNFLSDDSYQQWDGNVNYFGTDVSPWARHGDQSKAASLMYWLDAIVNCHGAGLHGLMGRLKRYGITTVASLHLSDLSPAGRPVGNTYLGLAFEHAYDFFAPCSEILGDWCHALGVPAEKIYPIPNAPGYALSTSELNKKLELKHSELNSTRPLRVMFLGRLDRQKGLSHLSTVMSQTKSLAMPVEWRVIGKSIIGDDHSSNNIANIVEPPIFENAGLTELYAWADVLLLLSDYEGLPLTILEAMRQGVVVIATNVGAVSEALNDEIGYLINPQNRSAETIQALSELITDRELLRKKGETAALNMTGRTWDSATSKLISQMDEKYLARNTKATA